MKYTVILRRGNWLMDIFEEDEAELYVANSNKNFLDMREAIAAARLEAAKGDALEVKYILAERGTPARGTLTVDPDNYEVLAVLEGRHEVTFGWDPSIRDLKEL